MVYLSLCIPTNGISEWVFPVLDSIYKQAVDSSLYEVIVTDNGENEEFYLRMEKIVKKYDNLIYKKTKAVLFENQIEALRLGKGKYLKFINHRSILEDGALEWLINVVKENLQEKPIIYLSNGALNKGSTQRFDCFDGFVAGLGHIASWTTGVGVWKSDFELIPRDHIYNKISPHSDVLFAVRDRNKYIINDKKWSYDIDNSHKKKGKYDVYKAFAIEEPSIMLELYLAGDITSQTLKQVMQEYKKYVAFIYLQFNVLKKPCSYDLTGFDNAMGIFMKKGEIFGRVGLEIVNKSYSKLKKIFPKNK